MKVLPAIDLKDGNCVRLFKGNFLQVTKYNDDPINQVKTFLDHDLNYLHIVKTTFHTLTPPILNHGYCLCLVVLMK